MPTTPPTIPRWACDTADPAAPTSGASVEPTEGKKTAGLAPVEEPAAEHLNWLFAGIYQFLQFIRWVFNAAYLDDNAILHTLDPQVHEARTVGTDAAGVIDDGAASFTDPVRFGTGTSILTPLAGVSGATPVTTSALALYQVKIVTLGGTVPATVGMKAVVSTDGGRTFGAEQTIDVSGGIVGDIGPGTWGFIIEFAAGTLVVGDTYTFAPLDAPLVQYRADGFNRLLVDHLGLPGGYISRMEENWEAVFSIAAATTHAQIALAPRWWAETSANAAVAQRYAGQDTQVKRSPYALLTPGTANGNLASLHTLPLISGPVVIAKLEFEFALGAIGANLVTWKLGLGLDGITPGCFFRKTSAEARWQCVTIDSVPATSTTDSNVTPVANVMNRFRIELFDATSTRVTIAGGGTTVVVRYFIDDQLVATHLTGAILDIGVLGPLFRGDCTAGASSVGRLGPVALTWARWSIASPV